MKTIQTYEQAIENAKKGIQTDGINKTMLRAYRNSREKGSEFLDFDDVIWETDIPELIEACKQEGLEAITISSNFSGMLETLATFEESGCRLAGLTKVPECFDSLNYNTGEIYRKMKAAAKIEIA